MENEKNRSDKGTDTNKSSEPGAGPARPGSDVEGIIRQLMGIDSMFQAFVDAETEGMIICENCYDNVFDDDENICTLEEEGAEHVFCCRECMEEWKRFREQETECHA